MKQAKKRFAALALAAGMLTAAAGTASAATMPFTDVPEHSWYAPFVEHVYEHHLFSGISATTFSPAKQITRAELVTVMGQLEARFSHQDPKNLEIIPQFNDVPADQYYTYYVGWAQKTGVVAGYPDGTFHPNEAISREQLAVILGSYIKLTGSKLEGTGKTDAYTDQASISPWAADAVAQLTKHGLLSGDATGAFAPKRSTSRAETAVVITRVYEELMYPTETDARYQSIRYSRELNWDQNETYNLLGGHGKYKLISDYAEYQKLVEAAKTYASPLDGDSFTLVPESYFETGSILAIELQHEGAPAYATKLTHCAIVPTVEPVHTNVNLAFFSRNAGGSTTDMAGYVFFIEVPKDVDRVGFTEIHRVESDWLS